MLALLGGTSDADADGLAECVNETFSHDNLYHPYEGTCII